ncbi:flagellar basal body protein [Litoreibacter albidus]|uniref:flagellar basal body protein n=1 Tax=Litoreibacter albidus TaxID=670155 RepID=UPI003734CDA3
MFKNLPLLQTAGSLAQHATASQKVISTNIANVDTPNYTPREVSKFTDEMIQTRHELTWGTTRTGHVQADHHADIFPVSHKSAWETKPNGNSVSLEGEILKSIDVERQHSKAITIYQHSVDLLKMSIGRGR